ncbi:MAG: phosphoribosyltransferase family protein [Phascolarctobacterium sp.]|nr:phosphoribosyltransferase family protein [Phascolarctobacterium sp.]
MFKALTRELREASGLFKEILYPRKCVICKSNIEEGIFCSKCRKSYLLQKRISFTPETHLIENLPYAAKDILKGAIFLYRYDGIIKDMLHQIKFEDRQDLLAGLREEADFALPKNLDLWLSQFDIISSIPTSKERLARRGFDVPQEIFAQIFARTSFDASLIVRARNTVTLFELAPDARRAELQGCFALNTGKKVGGKHILICDDIYTSGSTLAEAAICLLRAGASSVSTLTFAAARENWDL